jgi:hypothetical protein
MVNNDGDGCYWAHPNKAFHFVCGVEEGSAKVIEVVKDGDLPRAVCYKEKTVGLIELHYFFVKVCFKIHCAGKTGNVLVAGLVHRGEQVEESFQEAWWIMVTFYFYEMLLGGWLWLRRLREKVAEMTRVADLFRRGLNNSLSSLSTLTSIGTRTQKWDGMEGSSRQFPPCL